MASLETVQAKLMMLRRLANWATEIAGDVARECREADMREAAESFGIMRARYCAAEEKVGLLDLLLLPPRAECCVSMCLKPGTYELAVVPDAAKLAEEATPLELMPRVQRYCEKHVTEAP